jgi:hypothetical protein
MAAATAAGLGAVGSADVRGAAVWGGAIWGTAVEGAAVVTEVVHDTTEEGIPGGMEVLRGGCEIGGGWRVILSDSPGGKLESEISFSRLEFINFGIE